MGTNMRVLSLLAIVILQCLAVHAHTDGNKVVGRTEARRILNDLRQRHDSHVSKRSADNFGEEEEDIDQLMIRALRKLEEENEESEDDNEDNDKGSNYRDGAKLIDDALKGNVDPDSDVVNLLESMFVDEGNRHNLHPDGIDKIALKKGKVYGDTHDNHRLTQQQLDDLKNGGGRRRRNFLKSAPLWPDNIIPYTIDTSLSSKQRNVDIINKGIKQFDDYTCLKWVPKDSDDAKKVTHGSYIEFFSGDGCWSYVGKVFAGKQQVSLRDPGCVSVSTTVHEMTHAIGQMHEQSRSDRDNHVTMLWANTQGGTDNFNMAKSSTHDYNPYDYESVLQYSLTAFSNNGKPTMEFSDRRLDFLADSATGLMFYDIQDITDAYDCTKLCTKPLKQCQNGGFVLHTCDCHCPGGLTGTLCETPVTDPACGGVINLAAGETKTLTTINFNNGGPYPTGKNCVWVVKGPAGRNVQMTIKEMDLTTQNGACSHWLEIQYNLLGQTGPRRCGTVANEVYVKSDNGDPTTMLLKFDSTFASSASAGKGFSLEVTSVGQTCKSAPCKHGTCNDVGDTYSCTCDPNFTGKNCDTLLGTDTISCGFEAGQNCLFTNSPTNNYDWIIRSGSTPSSGTGPSGAKVGTQYMYAEVSSPVAQGDKFQLETPLILAIPRCMSFWYHMSGGSVGTLNILRNGNQVWTKSGSQGDQWIKAEVDIADTVNYKVTFEAIRGSSWQGDIAIDDVVLSPTPCGQPSTPQPSTQAPTTQQPTTRQPTTQQSTTQAPTTQVPTTRAPTTQAPTTRQPTTLQPSTQQPTTRQSTSQPVTTRPTTTQPNLHCTFEDNTCFLQDISSDSFDWTIKSGGTPSRGTGPLSAYEGNMYSYIEATGKATNAEAKLQSSDIATSQIFCLSFAYHMYGKNMGSLTVDIISAGNTQTLFSESGDKGNKWKTAYISVPPTSGNIEFTATRGGGFRSDIAIDDVHFLSGDCVIPTTTTPSPVSPPFSCTFEQGTTCFLTQSKYDDFDWTSKSGGTPSRGTGPLSAYEGNMYSYIEATGKATNAEAKLQSSDIATSQIFCLSFAYHMYGKNMGSLKVDIISAGNNQTLFSESGDKGNKWKTAYISVPPTSGNIEFTATRGGGFRSDIAIDDVHFLSGDCVIPTTTTPSPVSPPFSCTFEQGTTCFLTQSKYDDFDWTSKSGGTPSRGTGPLSAYEGNMYSYIEATGKATNAEAKLQSSDIATSQIFCLSFAYHMYGKNMGSLKVDIISAGNNQTLFSESGDKGNKWKTAYISVPPTSGNIEFTATRGGGFRSDIAIDDVHFLSGDCVIPTTTTPSPVSPPFSCTFEQGTTCFLTQSKYDDFDWTSKSGGTPSRGTGPLSAYEGNMYSYIEATGKATNAEAKLQSSDIATSQIFCLSFAYHMYGKNMGSLKVDIISAGNNQTLFSESGDKGNKWKTAYISVPPTSGNIEFTATRGGGFRSDIAIDDVHFLSGDCVIPTTTTPSPVSPPFSCTFEQGTTCFLTQSKYDDFDWTSKSGGTPSRGTGPLSAYEGNMYSYIEATGKATNAEAKLQSSDIATSQIFCLSFAYHMYGKNMGSLKVDIISAGNNQTLFSESGDKGNKWKTAYISVPPTSGNIEFTATRGGGFRSDIAIDDVHFLSGDCVIPTTTTPSPVSPPFSCTFEQGTTCFLTQSKYDDFDWTSKSGGTPSRGTGPLSAYEGNMYSYIEATGKATNAEAKLQSSDIATSQIFCLSFAYHMYGKNMGSLKVDIISAGNNQTLFSESGDKGNKWKTAYISVPPTSGNIEFTATRGGGFRSDIAIDDVHFLSGDCVIPTTTTPSPVSPPFSCTFEQGTTCFLTQSKYDDFDWTSKSGGTPSRGTGPLSAYEGNMYSYIEATGKATNAEAKLQSSDIATSQIFCLSFAYHMYGKNMGSLKVDIISAGNNQTLFSESGDKGNKWKTAYISVPPTSGNIEFTATRGGGFRSDIAIDDVHFLSGDCVIPTTTTPSPVSPPFSCTFEQGTTCFLTQSKYDDFDWTSKSGGTPSRGTGPLSAYEGNMYSYIEATGKATNAEAKLQSSDIATSQIFCLSFAYHMYGKNMGSLTVDIISAGNTQTLFSESGDKGNKWKTAYISVPPTSGNIEFTATRGGGFRSDIAIDDVHFLSGDCVIPTTTTPSPVSPPFSCTFEQGTTCFLTQSKYDDFDWTSKSGGTPSRGTGPLSAYEGNMYSYIEATGKATNAEAKLQSSNIATSQIFCLSFAYHMYGKNMGSLTVDIISAGNTQTLFSESGDKGNKWKTAYISVPPTSGNIEFTATRGGGFRSDIAIDDVHFLSGDCVIPTTTTTPAPVSPPLSCTFEQGTTCFLTQSKYDDFDWTSKSGRTPSSNTGPSAAFEGSTYSYTEATGRIDGDRAVLESQAFIAADSMCLSFAYHMYGNRMGELQVIYGNKTVFAEFGNKMDNWHQAEVTLHPTTTGTNIQFVGTRGGGFRSDIAIDNIQVTNGVCVVDCSDNPCSPNRVCIPEPGTTVGYRCDCAPGLSGQLCELVVGPVACTFEDGENCFLENAKWDNFDWTTKSGRTRSSGTGPDFAIQGNTYAYIEATGQRTGNMAALMTTNQFESGERCLTFQYNMYGSATGELRVMQHSLYSMELFSKTGEQSSSGSDWKVATIDVYHDSNDTIMIEATRGGNYKSDIAIDNVRYIPGRCGCDTVTCLNGGTCMDTASGAVCQCPPIYSGNLCETFGDNALSCTFDDNPCFLKNVTNSDTMDWIVTKKKTPSSGTGPGNLLDGPYAYIEATSRRSGNNAILTSEATSIPDVGPRCLRFSYNMYGMGASGMGTLRVLAGNRGSESEIWSLSGNQGDVWTTVEVEIPAENDLVVQFEGIRGTSYRSDIAIDTISLSESPCSTLQ